MASPAAYLAEGGRRKAKTISAHVVRNPLTSFESHKEIQGNTSFSKSFHGVSRVQKMA
jgi:hypothetical protein